MIASYWFAGREEAARYIQGPGKEHGRAIPGTEGRAKLIGGENFGFAVRTREDVRLAMDIMEKNARLQASRTYPVQHPTMHMVLSWHPGYRPSREEMREADKHFAKALGMENARRITWSHNEKEHIHTHSLWDTINPDTGKAYDSHQRHERLARAGILWEREKNQITPGRQRDHDIARAAEVSDHQKTRELLTKADGAIPRRRVDRAMALGGHLGDQMGAKRAEFIDQNNLTRFPANRGYSYSSKPLADEKTEYIRQNRPPARGLLKAHSREAKERARGVGRLYEDHSFEKTSKPRPADSRATDAVSRETQEPKAVGINDRLDWPWRKAGEAIRKKWQNLRPNRDFGKEVEEKGWDDPEVKRQWEKKFGPKREEKRDPPRSAEDQRVKNWQTQRERSGNPIRANEAPPWRKDEQRSDTWRRQKEMDEAARAAEKPSSQQTQESTLSRLNKEWERYRDEGRLPDHDQSSPMPSQEQQGRSRSPALPPPREIPMPNLNRDPIDNVYRPQQGHDTPALPRPREIPMPKIEPRDRAPETHQQELKPMPEHPEIARSRRLANDISNTGPGEALPPVRPQQEPKTPEQRSQEWDETLRKREEDLRKSWPEPEKPLPRWKDDAEHDQEMRNWRPEPTPIKPPADREESRQDGTAGKGRRDDTEAGKPGILPGGSHEHGSPSRQFRDELNESLRNIKPRQKELEKDRGRER